MMITSISSTPQSTSQTVRDTASLVPADLSRMSPCSPFPFILHGQASGNSPALYEKSSMSNSSKAEASHIGLSWFPNIFFEVYISKTLRSSLNKVKIANLLLLVPNSPTPTPPHVPNLKV